MVAVVERLEVGQHRRLECGVEAVLGKDVVNICINLRLRESDEAELVGVEAQSRWKGRQA